MESQAVAVEPSPAVSQLSVPEGTVEGVLTPSYPTPILAEQVLAEGTDCAGKQEADLLP